MSSSSSTSSISLTLPSGRTISQPTSLFHSAAFHPSLSPASTFSTLNPATGRPICSVSECTKADVDVVVAAARSAFESEAWQDLGGAERGRLLSKLADLLERDRETFAEVESLDAGKTVESARGDVDEAIAVIR